MNADAPLGWKGLGVPKPPAQFDQFTIGKPRQWRYLPAPRDYRPRRTRTCWQPPPCSLPTRGFRQWLWVAVDQGSVLNFDMNLRARCQPVQCRGDCANRRRPIAAGNGRTNSLGRLLGNRIVAIVAHVLGRGLGRLLGVHLIVRRSSVRQGTIAAADDRVRTTDARYAFVGNVCWRT